MKPALSPPISFVSVAILSCFVFDVVLGQGPPPPPPPPPLQPLNPPPVPAGNPITEAKANLGKALFWDEQLSATRTISCGSCHQPESGGSDPRSLLGDPASTHPGADGIFGTADDVTGSPGVILNREDGTYDQDDFFGMTRQVTGRYTPSAINAGYASSLFWDGRATSTFRDPVTNAVILNAGAALESQAAGPPVSSVEMAHQGRD
ncbi:MAG: cytochrome-c peroxidase, partial [Verrucomicrobiae bacterium]|nr:cytochrome-c peroxidase [Verrucomicrobiae bacterium]